MSCNCLDGAAKGGGETDMIVMLKRLVAEHMNGMERYGAYAGRSN